MSKHEYTSNKSNEFLWIPMNTNYFTLNLNYLVKQLNTNKIKRRRYRLEIKYERYVNFSRWQMQIVTESCKTINRNLFSGVTSHVFSQISFLDERVTTDRTNGFSLGVARVTFDVVRPRRPVAEGPAAKVAAERLFAGVEPHVALELVFAWLNVR